MLQRGPVPAASTMSDILPIVDPSEDTLSMATTEEPATAVTEGLEEYRQPERFDPNFSNRKLVFHPVHQIAASHAHDTLSFLSPFFWYLRVLGLCPRYAIFTSENLPPGSHKWWNRSLTIYCVLMGIFLWFGFLASFCFALVWPVMFCAGFQSIMETNETYCKTDVLERFLTPRGLNALIQCGFLFIGAANAVVSGLACARMGPMVNILRKYYALTKSVRIKSHSRTAILHGFFALVVSLTIGIPFIIVYEEMLKEFDQEPNSNVGYPFANIDTPIEKMEDWIAYALRNMTQSAADQFVLGWLKVVYRAENLFAILSCFAVPFLFSLMCDVMIKEWRRYILYLKAEASDASTLTVDKLRNIRHSHWMLCKMFWFLDGCFSRMIFLIYVLFIIMNSSTLYIVLKFGTVASGRDRFAFYQAIIMFISLEIIFSLVIKQAMRAHYVSQEVNTEIRDWQPDLKDPMDVEYLLLVNQVSNDLTFTAWNSFSINGAAYIKAVAVIFSYVLLMLQYTPSSMKYSACEGERPDEFLTRRRRLN